MKDIYVHLKQVFIHFKHHKSGFLILSPKF